MDIHLRGIVKRFDGNPIVKGVDFSLRSGEMFFLLGPSGCGKTTILRMLAGFYSPDEGDIYFGDRRMNDVPPHSRNTALVFQNYAVWPHMTLFENVAYGLRVRKIKEPELTRRVMEALEQVKLAALKDRKPTSLSGGQQQRVALARAIVVRPDLLLFDEPLSNLDAKLRIEMRDEIKRLQAETGITSLYVTHDQEEALSLASRIGVMHAGKIEQIGTPYEVYNYPKTAFVANFIGEMNFFQSHTVLGRIFGANQGEQVGFRPEDVVVVDVDHAHGGIAARVKRRTYLGSKNELLLETEERETVKAWTSRYFEEGAAVRFSVPEDRLRKYPVTA
ncbi:MAG: ABC transporter ATP-binding protein [Methylacidiphilales bacterium]|nr:ABC transporter ATP-binding protein [Candidatus Methylacidiphilales bacterium]MDW8348895.1 ABC transporter ATP-binding protein [Verrucomicrobiae bacterium]